MKIYDYRGSTYQFADGDVPEGAVLVKVRVPARKVASDAAKHVGTKQHRPRNKSA